MNPMGKALAGMVNAAKNVAPPKPVVVQAPPVVVQPPPVVVQPAPQQEPMFPPINPTP